ncbi:protein of unknown function [Burkholderia multivorans]
MAGARAMRAGARCRAARPGVLARHQRQARSACEPHPEGWIVIQLRGGSPHAPIGL